MYSMILMAAMTTGGETLEIGHRGGGGGCGGCYGGCYGGGGGGGGRGHGRRGGGGGCCGCYGGGYGGCYGGCYGGGYGGCYGGGYGGCYGGGYGGCYGGMSYGCMGGFGGVSYGGGCYGGVSYGGGCYGGGVGCYGGGVIIGTPAIQGGGAGTQQGEKIKDMPTPKKTQLTPASATIVVDLPADAKLSIDNEPTKATGSSRVFVSPTLSPGREYHYTLKAELVKDGKPVVVEKVIAVKAGEITSEKLTLPAAGVAQR